jgi:DNA-binding MarR family transcriptional regulator
MPSSEQSKRLNDFAEEVLQLSQQVWALESKTKGKEHPDISETEFLTLDLLSRSQPQTVGDLQRQIGVLPAQMSRIIRALENKAEGPLITCRINSQDKRKVDVELTRAGAQSHQAYRRVKLGSIQEMLLTLPEQDRDDLMRILHLLGAKNRKPIENK